VFFAVSGFVLSHVMHATTPGRFLKLRAVRLYPAYWLVASFISAITALGLWPGPYLRITEPNPTWHTILLLPPGSIRLGQYPLIVEWTLIYEIVLWIWLIGTWTVFGKARVKWLAAAWLAVLAAKVAIRPDFGSSTIPQWSTVWLSVFVAPFLLGILAYELRQMGRSFRWPALAAILALHVLALQIPFEQRLDWHFGLRGLAAGLSIWFIVQLPDVSKTNPLVRAGSCSYGLYLTHVPLMLFGYRVLERWNATTGATTVCLVGAFTLLVGLALGRLEALMHVRLKKLADRRLVLPAIRIPGLRRLTGSR